MICFRPLLDRRLRPIGVGVAGATYMGAGICGAVQRAVGMEVRAVFDEDDDAVRRTIKRHAPAARPVNLEDLCADPEVEVVVDGTADPVMGARAAALAIENGKHVISINIECDVTVGGALARRARDKGLVYTVTAGDEPGDLNHLYNHYDLLGFRIVAMGKGKNNPLNSAATPDDVRASLPGNGITAEQVCSFVDGSKTMFEMGCLGNAVGFVPDIPGMHGPAYTLAEIGGRFRARDQGGILEREGVVDYVTGPEISGGVWIVVHTDDDRLRSDFRYLKIGDGPYYMFYRRYHQWFIDTPLSILQAVLLNAPTIAPRDTPTCRVGTVAKRDLAPGDSLDGIGGFTVFGRLEREREAKWMLPLGLAAGAKLRRPVPAGKALTFEDVIVMDSGRLLTLWETAYGSIPHTTRRS
jgi:predicted homoserine dehydrogenase-like protein